MESKAHRLILLQEMAHHTLVPLSTIDVNLAVIQVLLEYPMNSAPVGYFKSSLALVWIDNEGSEPSIPSSQIRPYWLPQMKTTTLAPKISCHSGHTLSPVCWQLADQVNQLTRCCTPTYLLTIHLENRQSTVSCY